MKKKINNMKKTREEIEIIMFCPKCKKTPQRDEKQSNENWNVIPAECPECKVQLKIDVGIKSPTSN